MFNKTDLKSRQKPSKTKILLLSPILGLMLLIGWTLYWLGAKQSNTVTLKQSPKNISELEIVTL